MKTRRVKILVAVAKDGSYSAGGGHDSEPLDWVADALPEDIGANDYHYVWVEADVPLPPEPPTVEGKVVDDE